MENITLEEQTEIQEVNPFEGDEFKARLYDYYKQTQCLDHIQRFYNLNKITEEDFKTITGQEPKEKTAPKSHIVQLKKISKQQDSTLLGQELRLMDLEMSLPQTVSTRTIEINSDSYKLLKRIIEEKNYKDKESMQAIIEKYYACNRITENEKNELIELLG